MRGGSFWAKPTQVPKCPPTHGTPFIVGTGPPDTGVGAPLYPLSLVSAPATGATTIAAAQQPTINDPRRARITVILDPALLTSSVTLRAQTPPEQRTIASQNYDIHHNRRHGPAAVPRTAAGVHLLFTSPDV
jgi:hypothetical protein